MLEEITEESYEESHKHVAPQSSSNDNLKNNASESEIIFPISFLASGKNMFISQKVYCKHPTVQEILDIDSDNFGMESEKIYWQYVNIFAVDPYDCMVLLDDNGMDYEKTSSFQLFLFLYERYLNQIKMFVGKYLEMNAPVEILNQLIHQNIYIDAFKFFFNVDSFLIKEDLNNNIVVVDVNGNLLLNEEIYENVHSFIRAINGLAIPKDRIYPENDAVKQMLIQDMREDQEQKERMKKLGIPTGDEDDGKGIIGKYLSSLTWGGNGGITPFNRNQLHIFDLVDGFKRTNKRIDFENIMTGVYSGCVNAKSLNLKELHWTN